MWKVSEFKNFFDPNIILIACFKVFPLFFTKFDVKI